MQVTVHLGAAGPPAADPPPLGADSGEPAHSVWYTAVRVSNMDGCTTESGLARELSVLAECTLRQDYLPLVPLAAAGRRWCQVTLLEAHTDLMPVHRTVVADLGAGSGPAWLDSWLARHTADVVGWRREIHSLPELGRAERRTTELVARHLTAAGLQPRVLPSGVGLICDIGFGERCVALRADLDALPMQEDTGLPFASTVNGVMHACGHDVHTAMLLGAGLALASAPSLPGRVRLIFQPAEEVQPGGAIDVVADGGLDGVDRIFALHCDPRLEVGKLGTRVGADHLGVRRAGDPADLARRAHRPPAPDRRPGRGARAADHPAAAAAHPAGRPALGHRAGLGRGARRRGGQRHPAARRAARHPAHRRPRHLG